MKGIILSFRRGKHVYKPRQFILQVGKTKNKETAEKLVGKKVVWTSPQGTEITGKISGAHGNSGCVRALFEKGLPGQAITSEVEVI